MCEYEGRCGLFYSECGREPETCEARKYLESIDKKFGPRPMLPRSNNMLEDIKVFK